MTGFFYYDFFKKYIIKHITATLIKYCFNQLLFQLLLCFC